VKAWRDRRRATTQALATLIGAACVVWTSLGGTLAHAALGGDEFSVQTDQDRFSGLRRRAMVAPSAGIVANPSTVQLHEITAPDGSVVREYMTPGGVVFAVAWATHFKPDLAALFGAHAPTYADAASQAMRSPGIKRHVVLERADLVVHSNAHFNTFTGTAYVKSLVPADIHVDQLH